jgi:hypothetical protein
MAPIEYMTGITHSIITAGPAAHARDITAATRTSKTPSCVREPVTPPRVAMIGLIARRGGFSAPPGRQDCVISCAYAPQ